MWPAVKSVISTVSFLFSLIFIGCTNDDARTALQIRSSNDIVIQDHEAGKRIYEKRISRSQLEVLDAWIDTLEESILNVSIRSYVPNRVVRSSQWNVNFTSDLAVLNVQIANDNWRQYQWQLREEDLSLVSALFTIGENSE